MKLILPLVLAAAAATAASRSVREGVYTAEQAARGKAAYQTECARCHGDSLLGGEDSPPLVDEEFLGNWTGETVASLVELTRRKMPTDGPGKLSRQLCTDVVAYLLSANEYPAGAQELEPDLAALEQIVIEGKP